MILKAGVLAAPYSKTVQSEFDLISTREAIDGRYDDADSCLEQKYAATPTAAREREVVVKGWEDWLQSLDSTVAAMTPGSGEAPLQPADTSRLLDTALEALAGVMAQLLQQRAAFAGLA